MRITNFLRRLGRGFDRDASFVSVEDDGWAADSLPAVDTERDGFSSAMVIFL